jgi:hypothetical protein
VREQHRRVRWLGLALATSFALLGCSSPGGEPVSVTTPYTVTPAAAPSSERPSAQSSQKPAPNDLEKGRTTRSLKTGPVKVTVKYSLRNRVQQWSPGVAQPLTVSLTARSSRRMVQGQWVAGQKIYLSRVTAHLEISDATGHLDSPDPLVDRADVSPGFLVTSPTYYDQVFTLPPLPARATALTIYLRYEILLLQPSSSPRDYEKRTATDTVVISRP